MDPNETLRQAREAHSKYDPEIAPGDDVDNDEFAFIALDRYMELDAWISEGGFLPQQWLDAANKSVV